MKLIRLYIRGCDVFQKNTLIDFTHNNKPQDVLCLTGVNGSGKTTVLELIYKICIFASPHFDIFNKFNPGVLERTEFAQLDVLIDGNILSLVWGDVAGIQKDTQHREQQYLIIEPSTKTVVHIFENTGTAKVTENTYPPLVYRCKNKDFHRVEERLAHYAYQGNHKLLKSWINEHVLVGKSIDKIEKIDKFDSRISIRAKNGKIHGLDFLSSGEKILLIIATQLYLKNSRNFIFLIDGIEQGLHPEFQERAIKLLLQLQKDKDCQIIISSHSSIVWDVFKDKGLIDLTEMVL